MSLEVYIGRLEEAVSITHFQVGMIKAPFMALLLGLVACNEGLKTGGSAESLGAHTTTSVVKAIFLVTTIIGVTGLWPAILADTGATVLVTMNALRLLRVAK